MTQTRAEAKIVSRVHYTESDGVKAIWDELNKLELPRIDHLAEFFKPNPNLIEVGKEIEQLGQSCFEKPPIQMQFNRRFAVQWSDDWIIHLGRLTFNVSRANKLALFWKVKEVFGDDARMSGFFYYPPGGFKEWHTDFEDPQMDPEKHWRIYLIKSAADNESWFQYVDPTSGEIQRVYDHSGYLNFFNLVEEKPLWHGVFSNTHRYSLGIKLGDAAITRLLDLAAVKDAVK